MYIYIYISAGKNLSESRWGHDFPWKTHQRRLCRDQEYSRLRMLNRAKRTLPARDSSRNACSLLPLLRGVETAASTRGIIHRRSARDTLREQLDESSRGERASYRSRFRSSTPSSSSVSLPLDLDSVLCQERSSGHQWRGAAKESACHQLDQFETLYKEARALKQPRTLAGTSASSPEPPCVNPLLSLSPSFFGSFSEHSWPEIDLATKGRLTVLYRQFAMQERR